jgi:hypothetical protein
MAIEERRVCDVFGTTNDVNRIRIDVVRMFSDGIEDPVFSDEVDLSSRAEKRLLRFIKRGLPARKETAE